MQLCIQGSTAVREACPLDICPKQRGKELNACLLSAGDKPSSFVGSKQWIGAIELGYILDTLLGVSSKVITVSSGGDMPSKAREISHHFDTQVGWPAPDTMQYLT